MSDHSDILNLPRDEFNELLRKIDGAVSVGSAALVYNRATQMRSVVVFSIEGTEFRHDELDRVRSRALNLDHLLLFAYGNAPDQVISAWADDHGENLGDLAVAMVKLIASSTPHLRAEWQGRGVGLGRELGEVKAPIVYSPDASGLRALLSLESFEVSGLRLQPLPATHQVLQASLSRADINRLISALQSASEFIEAVETSEGAAND